MINKMKWARECSALATVLPELKERLDLFEDRFMKDTVVAHEGESHARSIELRRLQIGAWPDLLRDIRIAARNRETGRAPDTEGLNARLQNLHEAFCAAEAGEPAIASQANLRRSAILGEKPDASESEFPSWVKLLGRRNPETWEPKRLARIKKQISQSDRHSDRKLDEILLVELIGKSFGRHGDLMELVCSAAYYYTSPWAWKGTDGSREYYSKIICNAISRMHLAAFPIGALAWSHQRLWRNLPSANEAATCAIEAVMAVTETVLLLGREEVIVETDNQTFLAMEVAAKRLEDVSARLVEEAQAYSPTVGGLKERWNYDLTGVTMCLRHGGVYIDKKVGFFGYIAADIRGMFKWLCGYRRPHRFCWVNYLPKAWDLNHTGKLLPGA